MKNKNNQSNRRTIHQHVEHKLRHPFMVLAVICAMFTAIAVTDSRFREVMRLAYSQGWDIMGTYMHHEHPSHDPHNIAIARFPTVSSPF
ncbi:MAG TPA: hypothetical protein VFK47_16485 [Ktedonobacteraceae bacterium]|nr:hypothetical protein [Ktedonobacteraceae bacterium]